mgnify:CR=1 FL=1
MEYDDTRPGTNACANTGRGAALGVPTPANRALYALVRLLESKPRA